MSKSKETHLQDLKIRLRSIDFLKILKKRFTYEQLSEKLTLPVTVLNRYVRGHVIPSRDRANLLIEFFEKNIDLQDEILQRIDFKDWIIKYNEYQKLLKEKEEVQSDSDPSVNIEQEIKPLDREIQGILDKLKEKRFIDNTKLMSDSLFMNVLAKIVAQEYKDHNITKLLTAAVDGLPLAIRIADQLECEIIYAKNTKEVGVPKYIEETYTPSSSSGNLLTLYVPKHLLNKKDRILIVDDIIRSGYTQNALINICKKINTKVIGVFIMISIGNKWKELFLENVENVQFKVNTFLDIPDPTTL